MTLLLPAPFTFRRRRVILSFRKRNDSGGGGGLLTPAIRRPRSLPRSVTRPPSLSSPSSCLALQRAASDDLNWKMATNLKIVPLFLSLYTSSYRALLSHIWAWSMGWGVVRKIG